MRRYSDAVMAHVRRRKSPPQRQIRIQFQGKRYIREAWSGTRWIVESAATGTRYGKSFCAI